MARHRFSQKMNGRICFVCFFTLHGEQIKFVRLFFWRIYGSPICSLKLTDLYTHSHIRLCLWVTGHDHGALYWSYLLAWPWPFRWQRRKIVHRWRASIRNILCLNHATFCYCKSQNQVCISSLEGMCKPHFGNQDFSQLANTVIINHFVMWISTLRSWING